MSAHIFIASAHILIAFSNAISLSAYALIKPTPLSDVVHSPTVLGGDTPCLTAGDARRENPWGSDAQTSDAGSVAQPPPLLLPGFHFFVVTSSRCHTLSITT